MLQLADDGTLAGRFGPRRLVQRGQRIAGQQVRRVPVIGRSAQRLGRRYHVLRDEDDDDTLSRGGRGKAKFKKFVKGATKVVKAAAPIAIGFIPGGGAATGGLKIASSLIKNPKIMGGIQKGIGLVGKIKIPKRNPGAAAAAAEEVMMPEPQYVDAQQAPGNTGMDLSKYLLPALAVGAVYMMSKRR